jgi:hypothetical protein
MNSNFQTGTIFRRKELTKFVKLSSCYTTLSYTDQLTPALTRYRVVAAAVDVDEPADLQRRSKMAVACPLPDMIE